MCILFLGIKAEHMYNIIVCLPYFNEGEYPTRKWIKKKIFHHKQNKKHVHLKQNSSHNL